MNIWLAFTKVAHWLFHLLSIASQVYKVLGDDHKIYAVKEVYMKHVDPAVKKAYVNEVKLLTKLRDRPEIVTLYD